ncbi:FtsK/SpoIIIE domain-containing protein [Lacisediminihabitans changchengi]|uniref:FtsK domain-containing protein n=1 Tax=Lacisediminihabitans changchengi TaxID=2787634 RepID=A0A934SSW5_9MICO|nr:FtsK/SpoIIIE domain-containing protein [Lacisediminihabitans changchengi]MBK4347519.1 hypothetical protein [Lacisediminihabitans changchengi]
MTSPPDTRAGDTVRLRLPRPPDPPPRHPFPLLASLAPVVGSVVIWAITSSPFALVFALLGPLIAVASFADARVNGRRTARLERERFAADLADLYDAVLREHDRERERLHRRNPGPMALLDIPERDPERWHGNLQQPTPVVIGYGEIASGIVIDGEDSTNDGDVSAVRDRAATVDAAPVVVDARLGIGVCGPPELATSVARGLILQLANALAPETTVVGAESAEEWVTMLPHGLPGARAIAPGAASSTESTGTTLITFAELPDETSLRRATPVGEAMVAVGRTPRELPHRCRVVLRVGGAGRAAVVGHPDSAMLGPLGVVYLSAEQAAESAELLARAARTRRGTINELPSRLQFSAIPGALRGLESDLERARTTLSATFLSLETGPVAVDLVRHGPHAVVGGMTGSGKSELLLSWLLALAAAHSPSQVTFLLVDFKGGSAFSPITALPHVVGLVTDLDERTARRALHSLRAEVRHREQVLADAQARSIEDMPPTIELARLVIVVDEFAALVGDFAELHTLFADLAARGRSLGIHLILCTQRPAGVVRDSVLANVPLRLSLRVNNRADSSAVVGTDAAARLPVNPPGRAILALAGADPAVVQVAIVELSDIAAVTERWNGSAPGRRPWCPQLATVISTESITRRPSEGRSGIAFGVVDLPDLQRQEPAVWNPAADGSILVLGGGGAGKSELVRTLAAASGGRVIPPLPEEAWDAVAAVVDDLRRGRSLPEVLLIDDLDVLMTRFGDEHRDAFAAMLHEILRTGGGAELWLVLAARRLPGGLQSVVAGCESRVILRHSDRQEHLIAGGTAELYSSDAPPGRGEWRGAEVQVALEETPEQKVPDRTVPDRTVPDRTVPEPPVTATAIDPGETGLIVVTGRPAELTRRFPRAVDLTSPATGQLTLDPAEPRVWVADPQTWQARWSQFAILRHAVLVLIDRCTLTELRAITGQRVLPPPLDSARETAWLLHPDGTLERVLASHRCE